MARLSDGDLAMPPSLGMTFAIAKVLGEKS